jgi:hypothetical protein
MVCGLWTVLTSSLTFGGCREFYNRDCEYGGLDVLGWWSILIGTMIFAPALVFFICDLLDGYKLFLAQVPCLGLFGLLGVGVVFYLTAVAMDFIMSTICLQPEETACNCNDQRLTRSPRQNFHSHGWSPGRR